MSLEDEFDRIADAELRHLEKTLGVLDPDELEVELSQGVLTCTFAGGQKLIINSHHAARQIWMAAFRTAWHFSPHEVEGAVTWRTDKDELRDTLRKMVKDKLGREIVI
ncbi:MAG: iron donor protein CyaY [Polyangia bacterium]